MNTAERIQAAVASKMNVAVFRVRLRKPLLETLFQMHKIASPDTTLELYLSQVLEACVADWRRIRSGARDDGDIPSGPPVAIVQKPESRGGQHKKLSEAERQRIRRLSVEHGLNSNQIAGRFGGGISAQTVRRILDERSTEDE